MDMYSMTLENMTASANQVKDILLAKLEKDKVIKSAEKVGQSYMFVVHKKGLLGTFIDKMIWGKDKEEKPQISVFKVEQ